MTHCISNLNRKRSKYIFEKYDDYFIKNATVYELEDAGNEVYYEMQKIEYGSSEYNELFELHRKIVNKKFELCKNPDHNYRWSDKNRWEKD